MSKLKIILLVVILLISSMPLMGSMNAVASPPVSGDKAFANTTVSYTTIQSTTSSTTTLTMNAVENTTYSTWNETDNNFWTFNSAGTKAWANTTNASGYYIYSGSKVWFNGSFPLSYELKYVYPNKYYYMNIGILMVNFTIGGTVYTWSHTYNIGVSSENGLVYQYVYFDANITATSDETISAISFYQTYYGYVWNGYEKSFDTRNSAINTVNSTSLPARPTPVSLGWSYPNTISSSFSSLIVSNIASYDIHWSAQYSSSATYDSNTYTTSPITGVLNVYSISFKATSDYPVLSYTISYYLIENYTTPASYSYPTATDSYNINSYQTHIGEFWNSSTISFSFTLPSGASTSYSASYKILISNLTIALPSSTYISFTLSSQNFTYYSLVKYKSTYNITAYKNFTTAQSTSISFTTSELINNNPSYSYLHLGYSGHGSTETLIVNATNPFKNESLQITNLNWGDGSPISSSPVEYPAGNYYNFSFSHQYGATGTYTVTFLIVNAVGASSSLSVSESTSITLTLSISTTSNALPVKTDSYIYFNYTQVNLNLQNVFLYVNNILVLAQNVSSNTNYAGTVAYAVPYYLTQTATFTAEWKYNGGGISGTDTVQYAVANKVPTVGKWIILNYTIGTGATATKESVPYFYTQQITYNVSWSYFVWQIFLPSNAVNITVTGSPAWKSPVISVPADFNATTATFKLLENITTFQVTWLAPNPIGNALIVIQYYPESAIFGEFGVNIPFNQFNTYLNGKQIYSPTQQVNLGQTVVINTTTAYGTLISSYTTTVTFQTQFIEIPLNIVPLTIENLNSSYVIGFTVTQRNITQEGQYMMPLETQTFYIPAGTYNFSFTYLNFNSYSVVKYLNLSMTISGVSYFIITGVTLTNIDTHVLQAQENITSLVENVNITLSNSNTKIYNETLKISASITNTNSSITKQVLDENTTINNIYSKVQSIDAVIYAIQNNMLSDINQSALNISTKITVIKNLVATVLSEENGTFGFVLKFGTPAVSGENYTFPVFVYLENGEPANLSVTKEIARNLTLDYVLGNSTVVLNYNVSDIRAGYFELRILGITSSMAENISSNRAVIQATGSVKAGAMTNVAAGIIGSSQIRYSPSDNLNSLDELLADLSGSQATIIGRALTVIVAALALIYYSFRIKEVRKKRGKK